MFVGAAAAPWVPWLCLAAIILGALHAIGHARIPAHFTWFVTSYGSLFLLYPTLAPLFEIEIAADDITIVHFTFLTVGGMALFLLAYEMAQSTTRGARTWPAVYCVSGTSLKRMLVLLAGINILAIVILIVNAGGIRAIVSMSRVEHKETGGLLSLLAMYLMTLGAPFYTLLACLVRLRSIRFPLYIPLIVVFDIIYFLAYRTRTPMVLHAVALGTGWFLLAPRTLLSPTHNLLKSPRFRPTDCFTLILLAVVLLVSAIGLRSFRGHFEKGRYEVDIGQSIARDFARRGTLNSTDLVFRALEMVPEHYEYLGGQSYYRLLFAPIPRWIWPDKPRNTQRITAHWLDPEAHDVQTTPVGITGDLYINFGFAGIVGMFVYGLIFGLLDRGTRFHHVLFLSVSFPMIYHLVRGGFTNPVLLLMAAWVTCWFISDRAQYPLAAHARRHLVESERKNAVHHDSSLC